MLWAGNRACIIMTDLVDPQHTRLTLKMAFDTGDQYLVFFDPHMKYLPLRAGADPGRRINFTPK